MKKAHYRLGSGKWNPLMFKGGAEYNALAFGNFYGKRQNSVQPQIVTAHFLTGTAESLGWDNIRHKWDNGYTFSVYYVNTASRTADKRIIDWTNTGNGAYSPIELSTYRNGWYFDFHKPANTTSNNTVGAQYRNNNDNEWRLMWSNISNVNTNTIYRLDINATPNHTLTLYELDGTIKGSFSTISDGASLFQSSYDFYDGYYLLRLRFMQECAIGRIVIRDSNDNIIHDYIMTDTGASGNARYVLKDFIENYSIACTYTGTVTDVMTQNFIPAEL